MMNAPAGTSTPGAPSVPVIFAPTVPVVAGLVAAASADGALSPGITVPAVRLAASPSGNDEYAVISSSAAMASAPTTRCNVRQRWIDAIRCTSSDTDAGKLPCVSNSVTERKYGGIKSKGVGRTMTGSIRPPALCHARSAIST